MSGFPFLKSFRSFTVKRSGGEFEFQDVFLDKFVGDQEAIVNVYAEGTLEVPIKKWLLWSLYAGFLFIVLVFFGKTFYLQAFAGGEMREKAEENAIRSLPLGSERGVVYDQFMEQLVFNRPSFDFVCDKRDLPEDRAAKERILRESAKIVGIPFGELKEGFNATA